MNKLFVFLEFDNVFSDFFTKKDRTFFFQIGEGKYKPGLGKIIIFN